MRVSRMLATAALAALSIVAVTAAERRPLPSFTVTSVDGASVPSAEIPYDATWLLIYVRPHCLPCENVLNRIDGDERASASRIVVIGGGMDAAAVADLASQHPHMQASRWLADADGSAGGAISAAAAPTVFGMRGRAIEWRLAGAADGTRQLESILFTWLEKR